GGVGGGGGAGAVVPPPGGGGGETGTPPTPPAAPGARSRRAGRGGGWGGAPAVGFGFSTTRDPSSNSHRLGVSPPETASAGSTRRMRTGPIVTESPREEHRAADPGRAARTQSPDGSPAGSPGVTSQ